MTSPLEASVTLDDVFSVVAAKRVPLAPELAGYLTLEIADGADSSGGEVDPRTVYVGEEGSVALVRPKKENATGDAEASVRAILARLLEASGSSTPALGAVAKRKPGHGLRGLAEELEAALIPVNRSAGRRALARLAREVKRVTLGVGRNASVPAPARPPSAPPSPPSSPRIATTAETEQALKAPKVPHFDEETVTAKRPSEAVAENRNELLAGIAPPTPPKPLPPTPIPPHAAPPTPAPAKPERPAAVPDLEPGQEVFAGDEVESLLATFEVSKNEGDKAVSRELKAMVGLDPTPPPPTASALAAMAAPASARRGSADGVEDLLALADQSEPPPPPRAPQKAQAPPPAPAPAPPPSEPRLAKPPPPKPARPTEAKTAPKPPAAPAAPPKRSGQRAEPRAPKTSAALLIVALLALGAGTAAMWKLKPGFFTGRTPEKIAKEKTATEQARQQALLAAQTQRCKATLLATDVPPNAEVLLRVGQAPVDVERMPIGTRLEFVATAEGFAPKRAIVPADAAWDKGPEGKPRFELGVQLDASKAKPGAVDPWPAGEPGSEVGGKGAPGTVHIVASPRGAEAWLLTGVGPEARIEQLKCETDVDVLVAGPTSFRKRLHISAADIATATLDAQGSHLVKVSAK